MTYGQFFPSVEKLKYQKPKFKPKSEDSIYKYLKEEAKKDE